MERVTILSIPLALLVLSLVRASNAYMTSAVVNNMGANEFQELAGPLHGLVRQWKITISVHAWNKSYKHLSFINASVS